MDQWKIGATVITGEENKAYNNSKKQKNKVAEVFQMTPSSEILFPKDSITL